MTRLERHWYQPTWWMTALLALPEGLFALLSALRRTAYRLGWCRASHLPVPVVVIGNINVGGVGKTPLTLALLQDFARLGVPVGVISRGYGGAHRQPTLVTPHSSAAEVGDEPLLLAASGAPVVVGRDRVAAGRHLLALYPQTRFILSDDGLQHYALARTLEIVVLDGARGVGNGHLLPGGPLREPVSRLAAADALVINGESRTGLRLPAAVPQFQQRLQAGAFVHAGGQLPSRTAADFTGQRVVAVAGIGHPERFFRTLRELGVELAATHAFPDHHQFVAADLPQDADAVIVTAKDAVKLQCINHARLWVLPVSARLEPDLSAWILSQLERKNGRKIS